MVKNMGSADRIVRIVIGLVIAFLIVMGLVEGLFAFLIGVFAALLIGTALIGSCPFLAVMDIDTHPDHAGDERLSL